MMRCGGAAWRTLACLLGAAAGLLSAAGPAAAQAPKRAELKTYDSPYYVIHTDLDTDEVREAYVRMTKMAEEYHERTKNFSGVIKTRLPFYLYSNPLDYYAAGGVPDSAGVFKPPGSLGGPKLMAIAGSWHTVQHEGFHQFADATIGPLPVWVNEGLAEYFGNAIFTGDGYVIGGIPLTSLSSIQSMIKTKTYKTVEQMMKISQREWNKNLDYDNYLEAWAMVHFLAHADIGKNGVGKYQVAFENFVRDAKGNPQAVWDREFGADVGAFNKRWADWWLAVTPQVNIDIVARATVATMTSYFARAFSQGQLFDAADDFFAAAGGGTLKADKMDWLPPRLLAGALPKAQAMGKWTIVKAAGQPPALKCETISGAAWAGTFTLKGKQVNKVGVKKEAAASRPAEEKK